MKNFTPEQKAYILRRGELLTDSAEWRLWGLYGIGIVGPIFLPMLDILFFGLFVVLFGLMVFTQKKRTKRILDLDDEPMKEKNNDADPS